MRHPRTSRRPIVVPLLLLCAAPLWAAGFADLARTFESNRQALRDYQWHARTEIAIDGEPQKIERFEVRLDADGLQQRAPLPPEPGDEELGTAGRRKNRKLRKQAEQLQRDLERLIHSYTHPSPETTKQIFSDPFVWRGEGRTEGITRVQARNVVRQGDQVSLWLDSLTEEPRRLEILTSSGGEPVHMTSEFERIEGGPFYPASVVVETEIKEKKLVVTTRNTDVRRVDDAGSR